MQFNFIKIGWVWPFYINYVWLLEVFTKFPSHEKGVTKIMRGSLGPNPRHPCSSMFQQSIFPVIINLVSPHFQTYSVLGHTLGAGSKTTIITYNLLYIHFIRSVLRAQYHTSYITFCGYMLSKSISRLIADTILLKSTM